MDCRDVSIGAWFEACIDNVTRAPKGQNPKAPTGGKVGRPSKRTNGKLESEQSQPSLDNNGNSVLNSDSGPSTSQTDCTATATATGTATATATEKDKEEEVTYHIRYDE